MCSSRRLGEIHFYHVIWENMKFEEMRIKTVLAWGWQLPAPPQIPKGSFLDDSISAMKGTGVEKLRSFQEDSRMTILFLSIQTHLLPLVTKAPHCKKGVVGSKCEIKGEIHSLIKTLPLVPPT